MFDTGNKIDFYRENGYLKCEALFTPEETAELGSEMVRVIENWGNETIGWRGPWRDRYLPEDERLNTKAVLHAQSPILLRSLGTRHLQRPTRLAVWKNLIRGHRFNGTTPCSMPNRQNSARLFPCTRTIPFIPHNGPDFVDCLLHLDDTPIESGVLARGARQPQKGSARSRPGPQTPLLICRQTSTTPTKSTPS